MSHAGNPLLLADCNTSTCFTNQDRTHTPTRTVIVFPISPIMFRCSVTKLKKNWSNANPSLEQTHEYRRRLLQRVNITPLNRFPGIIKNYRPKGRRNQGWPLTRLLDVWDRNGSIRWGADKSLARPTSRFRTTESIVSLERGICSCAELQVFSCNRVWKEACQATRAISTTSRRGLSSSLFFLQGKAPKEIHAILTETLG